MNVHDPLHGSFRGVDAPGFWPWRAADEDDGDAQFAGGDEFCAGGVAAGVFADERVDGVFLHQGAFAFRCERAAGGDVGGVWHWFRNRVDSTDEVMVLKGVCVSGQFETAHGEEDAFRRGAEGGKCSGMAGDFRPLVALRGCPCGSGEGKQRRAGLRGGLCGVPWHAGGEGVGGIDECGDVVGVHPIGQPRCAPEAADAVGDGRQDGVLRAAGQRERGGHFSVRGQQACQRACLRGAAEDEGVHE